MLLGFVLDEKKLKTFLRAAKYSWETNSTRLWSCRFVTRMNVSFSNNVFVFEFQKIVYKQVHSADILVFLNGGACTGLEQQISQKGNQREGAIVRFIIINRKYKKIRCY